MNFTLIPPVHSEADTMRDCPICKGTGRVMALPLLDFQAYMTSCTVRQSCPECGGSGKLSRDRGARSSLD